MNSSIKGKLYAVAFTTLLAGAHSLAAAGDGMSHDGTKASVNAEVKTDASARSVTQTAKDVALNGTVKAKLLADKDVAGMKIDVDTVNQIVTLNGTVTSDAQMAKAAALAQAVDGVTRVDNKLKVVATAK